MAVRPRVGTSSDVETQPADNPSAQALWLAGSETIASVMLRMTASGVVDSRSRRARATVSG
ncbi:MAG: hypothetical protein ACF8CQ_02820 [Rhodopirellula sp. JB044]|uniref:hypothetical protein n=1 Tax=Rhodopirellula sp. JB044 TaxID=3342844 RepID=UPI00370C5E30